MSEENDDIIVNGSGIDGNNDNHIDEQNNTEGVSTASVNSDFELPDYIKPILNEIITNEGFTEFNYDVSPGSNVGDGFVAIILKVTITGQRTQTNGTTKNDKLVLAIKLPPTNEARRQFGILPFKREVLMYSEILPIFTKFQQDHGIVRDSDGFFSFPKCYGTHYDNDTNNAYIIMEDIREKGFKLHNKFKPVGYSFVQTWVQKLAQLHAITFAMKDQCSNEIAQFKELKDIMNESMANEMMMRPVLKSCGERAKTTIEHCSESVKQKFSNFLENLLPEISRCTNGQEAEPYSVVNHGDCWINNMMFKFVGGNPKYICLLDWQISRYATPVLDIVYFIFLCTDGEFRKKHYDSIIQLYYKSFREHLERLGTDANRAFPLTALLRHLKLYGKFGLLMAILIIPMLTTDNEDLPDMNEVAEITSSADGDTDFNKFFSVKERSEARYNKRMSEAIKDMCKLGYI